MKNYIFASDNKDELSEALDPAWKGPLPYTIIVDEKGNVIYREMGSIDFLKMRRAIVPALNQLKPWQGLSPIPPNPKKAASVRNGMPVRHLSEPRQEANVCVSQSLKPPRT